jgi:3-hydroxyacyl-CoA dehydrogenase
VTLVELDPSLIEKAKKSIEKNLERVAKKQFKDDAPKIAAFVQESLSRISGSTNIQETAKDTDIVIEAIVEKLEVKQKLFSSIDGVSVAIYFRLKFI